MRDGGFSIALKWNHFVPLNVAAVTFIELNRHLKKLFPLHDWKIEMVETKHKLAMHGPPFPASKEWNWSSFRISKHDEDLLPGPYGVYLMKMENSWLVNCEPNGRVVINDLTPDEFQKACERVEYALFPLSHSKI